MQNRCSCDAYDHTQVSAYDQAIALGYLQTRLVLHDRCYAEVNDHCRAYVEDCGQVVVRNEGIVSYLDDGHLSPEQIEIRSDEAEVNVFTDRSAFELHEESFGTERNHSVKRGV